MFCLTDGCLLLVRVIRPACAMQAFFAGQILLTHENSCDETLDAMSKIEISFVKCLSTMPDGNARADYTRSDRISIWRAPASVRLIVPEAHRKNEPDPCASICASDRSLAVPGRGSE